MQLRGGPVPVPVKPVLSIRRYVQRCSCRPARPGSRDGRFKMRKTDFSELCTVELFLGAKGTSCFDKDSQLERFLCFCMNLYMHDKATCVILIAI